MAGTNRKKPLLTDGPTVILAHPQLGENIGAAARAMANFGLSELRLVNPRDGWPSDSARAAAAKADHVIDGAKVFDSLPEALADLHFVYATTARGREMFKPVRSPEYAAKILRERRQKGERVGLLFGREKWGLESAEIALADEIITFPVNPAFASVNLAQSVLITAYEWMKSAGGDLPISDPPRQAATKKDLFHLFDHLEEALAAKDYFRPPHKKATMVENLRTILQKADLSKPEIHALRGVIAAFEERKKRPRKARPPKKGKKTQAEKGD